MPTYEYLCNDCGMVNEVAHSIKIDPDIFCPQCKTTGKEIKMERLISLNTSGFIFKQWTESQTYKISRDKVKQNNNLEMRQMERYGSGGPTLQPNVAGMEVDSWSDAKKVAKEAGMNTASYDSKIAAENTISKSSKVDDNKWKAAKKAAG